MAKEKQNKKMAYKGLIYVSVASNISVHIKLELVKDGRLTVCLLNQSIFLI